MYKLDDNSNIYGQRNDTLDDTSKQKRMKVILLSILLPVFMPIEALRDKTRKT